MLTNGRVTTASIGVLVLLLFGAVFLTLSGVLAQGGEKVIPKRAEYPSDQARSATEIAVYQGDQSRQREEAFRRKFVNDGGKLESLPTADVSTQYFGPSSLTEAVRRASAGVVVGTVVGQQILSGYVVSTIRIDHVVRGDLSTEVSVRQVGGPVEENGRAYAAQLKTDPLLRLKGTYLLFLGKCTPSAPVPSPDALCVGGLNGSQFGVNAGGVLSSWSTEDLWSAAYNGVQLTQLTADVARIPSP